MATSEGNGYIRIENQEEPKGPTPTGMVRFAEMKDPGSDSSSHSSGGSQFSSSQTRNMTDDTNVSKGTKHLLLAIKVLFGFIFFSLVLVCTVFSKLTLVSLTDSLRTSTLCNDSKVKDCSRDHPNQNQAVTIYWQLLFVIIVPTCLAFLRSFVFGVLGKTTKRYPWPRMSSVFAGIVASIFEVVAMSAFVFLVISELPPTISLLLLNGVFVCQIAVDLWNTKAYCCCGSKSVCASCIKRNPDYKTVDGQNGTPQVVKLKTVKKVLDFFEMLLENKTMKFLALVLQLSSLVIFIPCWAFVFMSQENTGLVYMYKLRPMVALPICLFILSLIWTNKFQEWIAKPNLGQYVEGHDKKTARYKSCFINSSVRLFLYPFVTYIIFAYATSHRIDPWCLHDSCTINLQGDTLGVFLVQLCTTFLAYIFAWVACTMTLSPYSMALPLLVSTPVSIIWYYISTNVDLLDFPSFTPFAPFSGALPYASVIAILLWVGQVIGIGYYILTKRNVILSKDWEMFLIPYYDGVFFEQQMILNRQTKKHGTEPHRRAGNTIQREPRTIFICSTMYHENEIEMTQMLTSIRRVAANYEREKSRNRDLCDTYESHIFFDGAINGTQLQEFGLQLLSLLKSTLGVTGSGNCIKRKTPYGLCLTYQLGLVDNMPFHIHFKDKNLVKPKKRWSQVMYMNYVINYRIKNNPKLTADNTFILTTDADIDFTAQSAVVLLDMLESNPQVGAVCARTHPKGSGPLYWYQIFDYAIGHWFQKPAEHMLGCVLCSPGCFSVFRCSALQMVMEEYSTLATNGIEFLMKDMGEDRWLCTLLIKRGWRLEYCAISEDQTYCPLDFGEFYGQRRRWIPSTIANLSLLISDTASITRHNDTVSILFILFQAIMIWSTAISPATVILVISSGLQSAYNLSNEVALLIISLLVIVSVLYGMICLFASPKTQIDVAKLLTFIFAIVMTIVIAGIFKDTINSIFTDPDKAFLKAPNCSALYEVNKTESYDNCNAASKYINSLPNTVDKDKFMLPISASVLYLGIFAFTFLVAAVLHLPEWSCLLHCIWYLLALPSGYLLLLIYSAANLDSQSWGTREASSGKDKGLLGWGKYFKMAWNKLVSCCIRSKCYRPDQDESSKDSGKVAEVKEKREEEPKPKPPPSGGPATKVNYEVMDEETRQWLTDLECERYIPNFEDNGYTNVHFISAMSPKDFEEIGIAKRGFRLRLIKAAKKLPILPIRVDVPTDVAEWLEDLELQEYTQLFYSEGYRLADDIENLKKLDRKELMAIGITRRAHLQRLDKALHNLAYPKEVELKMHSTKGIIENVPTIPMGELEAEFWEDLIVHKLKPVSAQLTGIKDVEDSLRGLRNTVLMVLFLVNIMWIIALYTVEFPQLADYGIDPRAFQLLFLAVYSFIIVIQFFMMICHRGITLVHYFGRITPVQVVPVSSFQDFDVVSVEKTLM